MGKLLYTINTVNNFMDIIFNPFGKPFAEENPDIEVYNIMDDSLLVDTRRYNGMTPVIASRMLNYAKAAESSGADGVICTCTSVNHATKMIRPLLNIPMINIEEPVAEMAAKSGKRIGVMGTIPTSPGAISWEIEEKAAEMVRRSKLSPWWWTVRLTCCAPETGKSTTRWCVRPCISCPRKWTVSPLLRFP